MQFHPSSTENLQLLPTHSKIQSPNHSPQPLQELLHADLPTSAPTILTLFHSTPGMLASVVLPACKSCSCPRAVCSAWYTLLQISAWLIHLTQMCAQIHLRETAFDCTLSFPTFLPCSFLSIVYNYWTLMDYLFPYYRRREGVGGKPAI